MVVKLISLPCLRRHNDVYTFYLTSTYSGINASTLKSNGIQEI